MPQNKQFITTYILRQGSYLRGICAAKCCTQDLCYGTYTVAIFTGRSTKVDDEGVTMSPWMSGGCLRLCGGIGGKPQTTNSRDDRQKMAMVWREMQQFGDVYGGAAIALPVRNGDDYFVRVQFLAREVRVQFFFLNRILSLFLFKNMFIVMHIFL